MKKCLCVALVFASACDVGSVIANTGSGGDDDDDGGADCPAQVAGNAAYMHTDDNTSHAGRDCISSGCHLSTTLGTNAPPFTYAGTAYDSTKTMGMHGVNVIIAVGGMTKKFLTDTDGNFYDEGSLPDPTTASPAVAKACNGPLMMSAPIISGQGSCNSAACHAVPGGTQGAIYSQ